MNPYSPSSRRRNALLSTLVALGPLAAAAGAQALDYEIDPSASPFTFSGTSNVGPIVGTPDTFDLGGTFALDPIYAGSEIGAAAFVGGEAVTIPAVLLGEVPSGLPGLPLASLTVHDLTISASSPVFLLAPDGSFTATVTFTVVQGSVDFVPLIGTPGTADVTGLMSDPTLVSGTLVQTDTDSRLQLALVTTIPFNEPALGVSGTIDLDGIVDATFLFVERYCFGDGTGAACPCGNASAPGAGEGCLSSFGAGATLTTSGRASASGDTLLLLGAQMPPTAPVLYFQGSAPAGGGAGTVFGDGLLCAAGGVVRLGAKLNSGGASAFPVQGDPISIRGGIPPTGATRWYQGWYRNQAEFCTADRFNLTNGVRVTWTP